jgi:CRISPR/Cas system-associated endoribonuclease Cas2
MSLEPSPNERQKQAFDLLRNEARVSHREGDGLRVTNLCETALQEIDRLAAEKRLLITIDDVKWAFVFQFYWLTHQRTVHSTRESLKKIPTSNDPDRKVVELIQSYSFFVEQPLMGADAAFERLKSLPLDALGEITPESAELARHLLELSWYHLVADDRWHQIAPLFTDKGPAWTRDLLEPVQRRLQVQTQLTVPSEKKPPLAATAASGLREVSELAELWLLHLHGKAIEIADRIKELTPHQNPDDYKWRLISDFWHTNPLEKVGGGDTQGVWLARRRQLSTKFPLLIFHDRRELRIRELLAEVYQRNEEGSASQRWEVLQLAMLHELAALRLWDFGMWREAARAQSETLLEAARWMHSQPGWTAQGLVTGVRAISLPSADKNPFVRAAIDQLEFASDEVLQNLGGDLFSTYPRQKHTASELLDHIGDLVPPNLWPQFTQWTVDYARDASQNLTGGFKLNTLKPWPAILPLVDNESSIWMTLLPEVNRLGQIQHCWRGDERRLFWAYMNFAPLEQVALLGKTIASVASPDLAESFFRADLIAGVESDRPELGKSLTRELFTKATLPEERLLLARHLEDDKAATIETEVRGRTIEAIERMVEQAVPAEGAAQFSFGAFIPGLSILENWRDEHEPLLRRLIGAVDSPRVFRNWIPALLNTIQTFVAKGPAPFAELTLASVKGWAKNLPLGQKGPGEIHGPFSVIQARGIESGQVAESLGSVCIQLLRRLPGHSETTVWEWIQKTLFAGELDPLPIALYVSLILAIRRPAETDLPELATADAILLTLRVRAGDSVQAARALAEALLYVADLLKEPEDSDLIQWNSPAGVVTAKWLITFLESNASIFSSHPDRDLRSAFAFTLWQLSHWQNFHASLAARLRQLETDRRARVRLSAIGGARENIRRRSNAIGPNN